MTRQTTLGESTGREATSGEDDSARTTRRRRCLSLTVGGPWGHFRRVDGNAIKATYRVIPRTTVAGLLAALVGRDRDSYYDAFARDRSGVAIQPLSPLRTMNLPEISLTTADKGMKAVNSRGKVSIRYPDPTADRQRSNYEVLVDPRYRIDVWTDAPLYEALRDRLEDGEAYYTPSLGLSEFLAEVTYHGEFEARPVEDTDTPTGVVSTVPDPDGVVPSDGQQFRTERSPGYMERTTADGSFSGRRTTGFLTHTYVDPGGEASAGDGDDEPTLTVTDVPVHRVDGRRVVFA